MPNQWLSRQARPLVGLSMFAMLILVLAVGTQGLGLASQELPADLSISVNKSANGTIIYVKADAAGTDNGTSWANAYPDLQNALGAATAGDEIWVAAGTYKPGTERTDAFLLKNGVAIYGGFNGTETARDERDWEANATILSGDLNGDDNDTVAHDEPTRADNSHHVVISNATDSGTVLDGVIITGGNASDSGGGMYNFNDSRVTVSNVIFRNNSALADGAGMVNYDSRPTLNDVTYTSNSASNSGGGMANGNSSPTLTDVDFTGNSATNNGGGMFNFNGSNLSLSHVTFNSNSALMGGGISNVNSSPIGSQLIFNDNSAADDGGGMHNYNSNPTVSYVTFTGNSAHDGGGMYNRSSSPQLYDVTFTGNQASGEGGEVFDSGGGMFNTKSSPTLVKVLFEDNFAHGVGGGMSNQINCSPLLTNVIFRNNSSVDDGGGMGNYDTHAILNNVTFIGNSADGGVDEAGSDLFDDGGGMRNTNSTAILNNVHFSGNYAKNSGGGMGNYQSTATLNNVTFSGNYGQFGGGISINQSPVTMTNSILWNNKDENGTSATTSQISSRNNSTVTVSYSLVQGGWAGTGNIDADPLFVSPINPDEAPTITGDFHLSPTSPAIDAGDNSVLPADTLDLDDDSNTTEAVPWDLDGRVRLIDGPVDDTGVGTPPIVDMGAYEYSAGSGFFSGGQSLSSTENWGVALGDLDQDGDLDAFVSRRANQANKVWFNNGNGTFNDSGQNLGDSWSTSVALADVDGDGDLDALVGNSSAQPNEVWLNDGAGGFTDSAQSLGNASTFAVALGDADGDADLDLFVGNYSPHANKLWLNDGAGGFTDSGQSFGTSLTVDIALADVDQDSDLDLFVANTNGEASQVWLNDGTGIFTDSGQSLASPDSEGVALGDLDGDQDVDLIIANNSTHGNQVWLNDGTGTFSNTLQSLGNSDSLALKLGDVDGDNDLDAFVANKDNLPNKVWLNDGSGTFTDNGQALGTSSSRAVSLGDLDGDGALDALVVNQYEGLQVWQNRHIIYVDDSAAGGNNGTSWANAYTDLQAALAIAVAGNEIWVAAATYKPTNGADRAISFQLKNGVALYGGFNGTETARDQRNWNMYQSILSGDIGAQEDQSDNSYHVVSADSVDHTAVLDGFTITKGYANGNDSATDQAGGIRNQASSPRFNNLLITENEASRGAGMVNQANSHPILSHVTFSHNVASGHGGGMLNQVNSHPTLIDVTFYDNSASSGGGIYNDNSDPTIISTKFVSNTTEYGAGLYNKNSGPLLNNVEFKGNSASEIGGGMRNYDNGHPVLNNVTFTGNSAARFGGAISNENNSRSTLTNVTIAGNSAGSSSGGISNNTSSVITVTNSIVSNNQGAPGGSQQIGNSSDSTASISYSLVQGGWAGTGNIDADPLFVTPIEPEEAPTTQGEFQLQPISLAAGAGNNSLLPADTADLDGDGDRSEAIPYDLAGRSRIISDTVDMGAYEVDMAANILAIYAFAFDSPPAGAHNLEPQLPEAMQSIVEATLGASNKRAVVLIDLPELGNTHIRVVENGVQTLISGLPDTDGGLSSALDEYDMADGATLGGFLKWALDEYANESSKTIFSYVGHGSPLVPETDSYEFSDSRFSLREPSVRRPIERDLHPSFTDSYPERTLISPYDFVQALDKATNGGQNPIAVLDLVHCFSATIEQFYELSNPGGSPYATTITGSPSYSYLSPSMLGRVLAASEPSDGAEVLAKKLIATHNATLAEDDEEGEPSPHPRLLVAVDSSKIGEIVEVWDRVSEFVAEEFELDYDGTREKIAAAYRNSVKYDTTFCEPDWSLQEPDALVDMAHFAYSLSDEFGGQVGIWAETTAQTVEDAIIDKRFANGQPWFANLEPLPTWTFDEDDRVYEGIALYADFQGQTLSGYPNTTYLSWQADWYTDEASHDSPNPNPHPYAFVRDTDWDEVIQRFWENDNVDSAGCFPALPPARRPGEVSAGHVLFPRKAFVTKDSPTLLSAEITASTPETPISPLVEFTVIQGGTTVFTNTVSPGALVTGTYQVDASEDWVPNTTGPFTLTVRVDADDRVEETEENDNRTSHSDRVLEPLTAPRPAIEANLSGGTQWISDRQVILETSQLANTISAPVGTLKIDSYQYQAGDDPNTHLPVKIDQQRFRKLMLPLSDFPIRLPPETEVGPLVLHVWAVSRGGPSTHPQVINVNYLPSNHPIAANETQYFAFYASRGESLQIDLDVGENEDANLFIWDPYDYNTPLWRATNLGDDVISIDALPADGRYVVAVHGETSSRYTLTHSDQLIRSTAQASRANDNPDAYVPDQRPTFNAPMPDELDANPLLSEVRVSNLRDASFTVSWLSEWETMGEVRYGTDPNQLDQSAHDKRGMDTNDDTHYVTINHLLPETTYYFDIVSGTTTDDNDGAHYTVTTGPTLNVPGSDTILGQVKQSDGSSPAAGTIVYITLQDADEAGSSGEAALLSALVEENGYWVANLASARLADLSNYFAYSADSDQLNLTAHGSPNQRACQTADTASDSPTPSMDFSEASCILSWPIDIQPGWNSMALPLAPTSAYKASDVCREIAEQGGSPAEIDRWYASGWEGHICSLPPNDATLNLAAGYFIKANQASSWTIEGTAVISPQALHLQVGWNSISVPHTDAYTASSLCDEIISQSVAAVEINRWHNAGWQGHICGESFNNFDIARDKAYFVKVSSPGTVIPTLPASLPQPPEEAASQRSDESSDIRPVPQTAPAASEPVEARDLNISNVRDTSVTLTWLTDQATTGYVLYGQTTELGQIAYDVRDATVTGQTHYVTLSDLMPQTTYYFKVVSGAEQDQQELSTLTTAAALESLPDSDTIYGKLFQADGVTPATGALIHLTLQDQDGHGSNGQSQHLSALVDADGYWHHNLGNARVADGSHPFQYDPTRDTISLTATTEHTTVQDTRTINTLRPAEPLTLPHNPNIQIYLPLISR
ncbi:MAG: FG-GAP-like repeat-containing protein [Ardenticatenaceae bacterium]